MKTKDKLIKQFLSIKEKSEKIENEYDEAWTILERYMLDNSKRKEGDRFIFRSKKCRIAKTHVVYNNDGVFPENKISIMYYCVNDEQGLEIWLSDDCIDNNYSDNDWEPIISSHQKK